MSVETLLSEDGILNDSALSFRLDDEDSLTVITAIAAHNVHQDAILDTLFHSSFSAPTQTGIKSAFIKGDDSAIMTELPHHCLVLLPEPIDGPDRTREESVEKAHHLAVSMSDALLVILRMNDLTRAHTNGVASLRASLTQMLVLQADNVVPTPTGRRAFFVVVHDYESEIVAREDIIVGFQRMMADVYANVARPPGVSARFTDLFDFEFFLLPSERAQPDDYQSATASLTSRLLDPAADEFLFEHRRFSRSAGANLAEIARNTWDKLNTEIAGEMPPPKDLMSAFDCDNAMRNVFEKYQRSVRVWRRETEGGEIIENFGEQATNMVQNTINVFEQDASPHRGSKAFKRKKEELKDLLDADLYNLFVLQIAKLREATYRAFKDKLDTIEESDPRLERAVNTALKDAQTAFRKDAEILKPRFSSWRYDNDTKELVAQMREDATEQLQRARLADYQESGGRRTRRRRNIAAPGTKRRQPINVSFHYLDPAPFGWKDSRYEKLSVDDNLEFHGNKPTALGASAGSSYDGLSVPLAPTDKSWHKSHQDFIYSERK